MGNLLINAVNYLVKKPTLKVQCWVPTTFLRKKANKLTAGSPLEKQMIEYFQNSLSEVKKPFAKVSFARKVNENGNINKFSLTAGGQNILNGSVSQSQDAIWKFRLSGSNGKDFQISGFVDEVASDTFNGPFKFSSRLSKNGVMQAAIDAAGVESVTAVGKHSLIRSFLDGAMATFA